MLVSFVFGDIVRESGDYCKVLSLYLSFGLWGICRSSLELKTEHGTEDLEQFACELSAIVCQDASR